MSNSAVTSNKSVSRRVQRLADGAQRLRELLDRMFRRHIAGFEMHFRHAAVIARDEAVENLGQEAPLLFAEPAHDAEVDGDKAALLVDEEIALMHVGMEKAVAHGVTQEGLQHMGAELLEVVAFRRHALEIGERRAIDPFERQHLARRAVPVDMRHANIGVVRDILAEFRRRRRFEAEVGFELHRAGERVDDLDHPQAPAFRRPAFGEARDEIHVAQVARELALDPRSQDFHRDLARLAVVESGGHVHLRHRSRGDGLAETDEDFVDRPAQRFLDDRHGLLLAEGRHAVLKRGQRVGDLAADDIRSRRQKLAELHIGGADLRERAHQRRACVLALAGGEEIGETHQRRRGGRQQIGVERREDALARQNITGARQSEEIARLQKQGSPPFVSISSRNGSPRRRR
jgi:hypothetical protein